MQIFYAKLWQPLVNTITFSKTRESPLPDAANNNNNNNTNNNNNNNNNKSRASDNPQYVHIVNELLESEKKYIHYLQILNLLFLLPLRDSLKGGERALIGEGDLRHIFSYVEAILNLHTAFAPQLQAVLAQDNMEGIGAVFLKNWEFFKMYSSYINGYNLSLSTLADCKQKYPPFEKFIEAAESNPMCAKLDLASYLIMPVQRLPRYILLLSDLLKQTPNTSQDYVPLQKSIDNLHSVMVHLNESKRVAENSLKVFEIQQSLIGKTQAIMEPHRIFHSEGNCTIRTTTTKIKSMHYFLFNDMILLVSPGKSLFNKDEWRVHFQLLLSDLSFSILQYEKGLLIKAANLKLIMILDSTQQIAELLDTLQTLKGKLPSLADTNSASRLYTSSFPKWVFSYNSRFFNYKVFSFVALLMSVGIHWIIKKN